MLRNFLIAIFLFIQFPLQSQNCGTEQPAADQYIQPQRSLDLRNEQLKIPVVFHMVLEEDHAFISDAQVQSQLDALNRDFNLRNTDIHKVPSVFRKNIAPANITFCLALQDPNGDPTNGITRTVTDIPNIGQHTFADGRRSVHYNVLGGKNAWDTERYLNIWVAELESFSGRSSFPGMGPPEEDGVVIDPAFFGNFGISDPHHADGRTLVHEIGHYLNLRHPWLDDGCDNDDNIEDTPPQDLPYFGCPNPLKSKSCGSLDMVQNFMQYGHDPCLLYFTKDQTTLMRTVLMTLRDGLLENATAACSGETTQKTLSLFYNPVKMDVQVKGADPESDHIFSVIDISGRVHEVIVKKGYYSPSLDLSYYPNGIYIIQLKSDGQAVTKKVFKYD